MPSKTRKARKSHNTSEEPKNLTEHCKLKSCKAQMYKSVYGGSGLNIRANVGGNFY